MVEEYKFDFLVIVLCSISIFVLDLLYNNIINSRDFSNSKVIVSSNKVIENDLISDNCFYLLYDDINTSFLGNDYSLIYTLFDSYDITGRNIMNDFEVILPEKYKNLLNERIYVKINEDKYSFLVVGIYDSNYIINDKYIYTSRSTLEYLYKHYNYDNFNYIFVVDNYFDLNSKVDLLRENDYVVSISNNSDLESINNYNIMLDSILLFIGVLFITIVIFVFHIIF